MERKQKIPRKIQLPKFAKRTPDPDEKKNKPTEKHRLNYRIEVNTIFSYYMPI